MEKIIIYTNETCPYCKQVKEKLTEEKIKFEDRLTSEFKDEWQNIIDLTGMPTLPTIHYKNNYFVPNRDFGNPQGLINLLKEFKESELNLSYQNNEAIKTLSYNIIMAFNRMDQLLKQIEINTKKEEDEHKSTS